MAGIEGFVAELLTNWLGNTFPSTFGDPRMNALMRQQEVQQIGARQREGLSLKDQGYNPKMLENIYGAEMAAPLLGYEQSGEFKALSGVRQAAQSFLTAPVTQTYPDITPAEASGFFPLLRGQGIGPAEQVTTANLTRPDYAAFEERFQQYPALRVMAQGPQAEQAAAGAESRALQRRQLEEVEIPNVGIAARQAAVGEANVGLRGAELAQRRFEFGADLGVRTQTLAAELYPSGTPEQIRAIGKYFAARTGGQHNAARARMKRLGILGAPGMPKGRGAFVADQLARERDALRRLDTEADRVPNFVKRLKPTDLANYSDETLATETNAAIVEMTKAALASGGSDEWVLREVVDRATVAVRRGGWGASKVEAVPLRELEKSDPVRYNAVLRLIGEIMQREGAVAGSRGDDAIARYTGQAAPSAASAAAPTPAPPAASPRSARRGATLPVELPPQPNIERGEHEPLPRGAFMPHAR